MVDLTLKVTGGASATLKPVEQRVRVEYAGAEVIAPVLAAATEQVAAAAGYAEEIVDSRLDYATLSDRLAALDGRIDEGEHIAAANARAARYGITDPVLAQDFGANGVELDFATGYFRRGYRVATDVLDLDGFSFARPTVASFARSPGSVAVFDGEVPRVIAGLGFVVESMAVQHAAPPDLIATGAGVAPVVTPNTALAPDGTATASQVTLSLGGADGAGDRSLLQQDLQDLIAGRSYTSSYFVKGPAGQRIAHRHVAGGAYALHVFNGEWQRMGRTELFSGGFAVAELGLRGTTGCSSEVTFLLWKGQIEEGTARTSQIPAGSLREPDDATLTGLAIGDCTVIVDFTLDGGGSGTQLGRRAVLTLFGQPLGQDQVTIINDAEGLFGAVVETGGAVVGTTRAAAPVADGQPVRLALRLTDDDVKLFQNGVAGSWDFDVAIPRLLSGLAIGGSPLSAAARLGGLISRIAVFPFAMSDAQLIVATGGQAPPPPQISWELAAKSATFAHRDSARTWRMGGRQFIARGFQPGPVLLNDIYSSANGVDYTLVNADPGVESFSQFNAVGGVIYAWNTKMFRSVDGGKTFAKILDALPWGPSPGDNPTIVHRGQLLYVHGTGYQPVAADEGVWRYDPVANAWTKIAGAPWGARDIAVLAEFKGDLYLQGGSRHVVNVPPEETYPDRTTLNDLWKSTDGGVTWARIVADLPCAARMWPFLIEFENRFYLGGGYDNVGPRNHNFSDTWASDDAVNWRLLRAEQPYLERHAPVAYVFNGALYLASGNANAQAPTETLGDIWRFVQPI